MDYLNWETGKLSYSHAFIYYATIVIVCLLCVANAFYALSFIVNFSQPHTVELGVIGNILYIALFAINTVLCVYILLTQHLKFYTKRQRDVMEMIAWLNFTAFFWALNAIVAAGEHPKYYAQTLTSLFGAFFVFLFFSWFMGFLTRKAGWREERDINRKVYNAKDS